MANGFDFKRLRRTTVIHAVVQVFLFVLLLFMAFRFQAAVPQQIFMNSLIRVVVVQLLLFYPVYKYALGDAAREVDSCATGLTTEELGALRKKRVFSDIVKGAMFIFVVTFILRAPQAPQIQLPILFVTLLTMLTYFQCFNFAAKRLMRENG